jgi:hypothetical protein
MSRPKGATLDEIIEAADWLPHTTPAALTGLRKRGFAQTQSALKQDYCAAGFGLLVEAEAGASDTHENLASRGLLGISEWLRPDFLPTGFCREAPCPRPRSPFC